MDIRIRALEAGDLDQADRVMRLAFGTFVGLADPPLMFGDQRIAHTRWHADPQGAIAAEVDGRFAGSNFIANWGSVGYFGPLSVAPEFWGQGVAERLLEETVEIFRQRRCRIAGLYTFSHSAKHIVLYQRFGFWPRYLTAICTKPVAKKPREIAFERFSDLSAANKAAVLSQCGDAAGAIYDGLNLRIEIESVDGQKLGETLIIRDGSEVSGFAICHVGAGSEAGSDSCYVKFGCVRPGANASANFERLLDVCESYAASVPVSRISMGVNTARTRAYHAILARGVRFELLGVVMIQGDSDGYNQPDAFVIDDWR